MKNVKTRDLKTAEVKIERFLLVLFLVAMLIGHVITFNDFRLFGVVVTIQRLTVFYLVVSGFYLGFTGKKEIFKDHNQYRLLFVFILWLFWGMVALLMNSLSSNHAGLLELVNIFIGGIFILALYNRIKDDSDLNLLYLVLKIIGIAFLAFAYFEITSRYHLPVSRLRPGRKFIAATAIFYNENDFSTALGLLIPLFLAGFNRNLLQKISGIFLVMFSFYIMYVNDAWIVMAFVLFGLISQIWIRGNRKVVYTMVAAGILFLVIYRVVTGNGFSVLEAQISSMMEGSGSLYNRLMTYKNSLMISKETYFMGLGPKGFSSYMENSHLDGLTNPHNLWLEILSQYGLLILLAHVGLLVRNFIFLYKNYKKTGDERILVPITIYIIYIGAGISSSNFLSSIYQWLPLAIGYAVEHYLLRMEDQKMTVFDRYKERL